MQKKFVSNGKESARMFRSNALENLSKVHFSVPIFIFIPVIAYFLYRAVTVDYTSISVLFINMASGLLVWTLTEYVLHRFVFHFVPDSTWGKRLHFIFHGVHHDYPNDAMRLVMPPSVSVPLAIGFFLLFRALLPAAHLSGFFAAFIAGYLFYDISHYALHHANFKSAFWKKMKQHHMHHHYSEPDKGYGVSSVLWDKIFKSDFEK